MKDKSCFQSKIFWCSSSQTTQGYPAGPHCSLKWRRLEQVRGIGCSPLSTCC